MWIFPKDTTEMCDFYLTEGSDEAKVTVCLVISKALRGGNYVPQETLHRTMIFVAFIL